MGRPPPARHEGGPVPLAIHQRPEPDALYLQWLGVSSWIVSRGPDAVVVDPFFSRPPLRFVARSLLGVSRRFSYDEDRIAEVLPDLPPQTRFLLIGHGHYDHLMDVPYYLGRESASTIKCLGSRTARNILAGFRCSLTRFTVAADGTRLTDGSVRVTAFRSDHAPHLLGIRLMHGEVPTPLTSPPTRAGQYRDGVSQAYLVDFLDGGGAMAGGRVAWRVFVNGAASSPGAADGLRAHVDILRERRTDAAILCVPGWNQVRNYPESILEVLTPRHVVLSHYDDFFSPYRDGDDPRAGMKFVMFADYPGFVAKLDRLRKPRGFEYHEPRTGQYLCFDRPAGTP
jgi:L-ascorbate metabolism protein UlaG (beta-lactamase superfamily)